MARVFTYPEVYFELDGTTTKKMNVQVKCSSTSIVGACASDSVDVTLTGDDVKAISSWSQAEIEAKAINVANQGGDGSLINRLDTIVAQMEAVPQYTKSQNYEV